MQTQQAISEFKPDFTIQKSNSKLVKQVWTRWEHGNFPVLVWETETRGLVYELAREDGSKFFRSARRLLHAVTGRPRHQTFDRYFKIDEAQELDARPNVIQILDRHGQIVTVPAGKTRFRQTEVAHEPVETQNSATETQFSGSSFEFRKSDRGLKLTEGADETLVRGLVETFDGMYEKYWEPKLGIDLENRAHEVRKLLFATHRGHMLAKGYDPDDVLQEIYKGLIARNNGRCPWDGRTTFGYYVTMVIRCVLINYHRKMERRKDWGSAAELDEGMMAPQQMWSESSDGLARDSLEGWLRSPEHGGDTPDGKLAVRIMPMVAAGMTRREIVEETGERENLVSRALAHLRKWSKAWADEIGVPVKERKRRRRKVH